MTRSYYDHESGNGLKDPVKIAALEPRTLDELVRLTREHIEQSKLRGVEHVTLSTDANGIPVIKTRHVKAAE